jgi:hypothetical protein
MDHLQDKLGLALRKNQVAVIKRLDEQIYLQGLHQDLQRQELIRQRKLREESALCFRQLRQNTA